MRGQYVVFLEFVVQVVDLESLNNRFDSLHVFSPPLEGKNVAPLIGRIALFIHNFKGLLGSMLFPVSTHSDNVTFFAQ